MYQFLLLDLDDTILDFHKAEYIAIRKTLREFGIDPTEAVCDLYREINLAHWKALEKKLITRERLMFSRFEQLFGQIGVPADPVGCGKRYMDNLGLEHDFLPGAFEAVSSLYQKYKLFLASNGTTDVQITRIADSKIAPFFQDIFISEQMGADKPDIRFFEACFARIPGFDPSKTIIVGDSLSSDIQGGINAGIATCWVNPTKKAAPKELTPDYQIESITQLESLLANL